MATYLVKRRMDLGWIAPAGGLVVDPPDAELLMERNYIQSVADDFPGVIYDEDGSRENSKQPSKAEGKPAGTAELPKVIDLSKVEEKSDMGDDDKTEDRKKGAITEPDGSPVVDETGPNGPTAVPQDSKHVKVNENDQAVDKKTGELLKEQDDNEV